jgi:hypothetical protein
MNWYRIAQQEEDYRGGHQAPDRDGAPLYDLTKIYPDDIYSYKAAEYYGHYGGANPSDARTMSMIQGFRGKPNSPVTIYRAVPIFGEDLIDHYEKQKAYILKTGKIPDNADDVSMDNSSEYYDYIWEKVEELKKNALDQDAIGINSGDWVTINRAYAKEHGESSLKGQYKIISKRVKASEVFTDGNSIHEWGYIP